MSKEAALSSIKSFTIDDDTTLSLWAFKRKANGKFAAKSIVLSQALEDRLCTVANQSLARMNEVDDYGLLTLTNPESCLYLEQDETILSDLIDLVDLPPEEHVIHDVRDLKGSAGYVVKFWHDNKPLYCVKKLKSDWIAKRPGLLKKEGIVNTVLRANRLELMDDPTIVLAENFDFFSDGESILVTNKLSFESLLSYRAEYQNSFANLQANPVFSKIFVDLTPLVTHVGTNTQHLRRMAVIEERAHYADAAYMQRLRDVNAARNWGILFDENGRIIATQETARVIMQVLLNHRLFSELSLRSFDVPSSSEVGTANPV